MKKPPRTGTTIPDSDRAIKALRAGGSARISGYSKCWVTIERSADGQRISYIRHTKNTWKVFHSEPF
jgi:hypothetical protein